MSHGVPKPEYHVGFVMEQAMGHVTHHRALAAEVERDPAVRPSWMPVPYQADDAWQRMPGISGNLSLLLSLRARREVRRRERIEGPFHALLYHTQVTALLSQGLMRRVPVILSLDATPLNADPTPAATPNACSRRPDGPGPWDRAKREFNRRSFTRAAALIAWSDWARRSLIEDYGVNPAKVAVIPPGVDVSLWQPRARRHDPERKPRLLFVGAHFQRKGGDLLLSAFHELLAGRAELDVVTPDRGAAPDAVAGVRVHRGLSINSPELRELYAAADLFVLPTLNDCTPLAVLEAMASGLPVIAGDVGAVREQVKADVTGLLVRPGDRAQLAQAIFAMLDDPARRRAMGAAGRARAERLFCAQTNYAKVLRIVKGCVDAHRSGQAAPAGGDVTDDIRAGAYALPRVEQPLNGHAAYPSGTRADKGAAARRHAADPTARDPAALDLKTGHQAWASEH